MDVLYFAIYYNLLYWFFTYLFFVLVFYLRLHLSLPFIPLRNVVYPSSARGIFTMQ